MFTICVSTFPDELLPSMLLFALMLTQAFGTDVPFEIPAEDVPITPWWEKDDEPVVPSEIEVFQSITSSYIGNQVYIPCKRPSASDSESN